MERMHLDTNQCAELIRRVPDVVRRLARDGEIPFRRINGRYLFCMNEIQEWIHRFPGKGLEDFNYQG